jgi:hypothetical protein
MMQAPDLLEQRLTALTNLRDDSDWSALRRRRHRPAKLALAAGALIVIAVLGVGAAFGLYGDVLSFGSQEPAPPPVVKDFETLFSGEGAPPGMDPHVRASETRRVATFANGTHNYVLYVAPAKNGGFCESFVNLFGGCRQVRELPAGTYFHPGPGEIDPFAIGMFGSMSSENTASILGGDLLVPPGTSLSIEFADGSSEKIPVVFVSAPIDAGFFLYPVPAEHIRVGHQATYLIARDQDGEVVAKARISGPSQQSLLDPSTGIPAEALVAQRRRLISITTEQGADETLWAAPRRGGGQCHWLASDDNPARASGCSPTEPEPQTVIAATLLSGRAPILFEGQVQRDVALLELHYQDGEVQHLQPVEGFVLGEVASRHWQRGHRLDELVARDLSGRELARQPFESGTPGTYPCEKPIDLGNGAKACP